MTKFVRPLFFVATFAFGCFWCLHNAMGQERDRVGLPNKSPIETYVESWQSLKKDLREVIAPFRQPEFEIRLLARNSRSGELEKLSIADLPSRVLLVIGGLQTSKDACQSFANALENQLDFPADSRVAVFEYPNDGSILESGRVLKQLLRELHRGSPKTNVSIIAHSMGGLVARYALESPCELDQVPVQSIVDRFTMICPPNHGSILAQYAEALEIADALSKMNNGQESLLSVINALIDDGLGEACEELVPDSTLLRELNGYARVANVRYTIIAGTGGPISPLVRLASSIVLAEGRSKKEIRELPALEETLRRAEQLLGSDELTLGLGDGAVSVRSARLAGVDQFIKLPFHHAEWSDVAKPQVQDLVRAVALSLSRP
jgi:hypothetical protein